ncbi:hypothetical protein [Lewinella sp. IMCC34183]|uniref:hypothetical protein n=1 Tax=Lewinella sp. IMCC34183 TaxID=2248762 RepID=UPI000E24BFD7|nr:hypothetical protein [Lewinella sp. IMCC34183]
MSLRPFCLLLGLLFCLAASAVAQSEYRLPQNNTRVSLTEEDLRDVLTVQFSKFITANNYAVLGSFAEVSTTNGLLDLGATFIPNKNVLFTTNVSAGAIDGVAGLFNNGKLNSKVVVNAAAHRLLNLSKTKLSIDRLVEYDLETERAKVLSTYTADTLKFHYQYPLVQARLDRAKERRKLTEVTVTRDSLLRIIRSPWPSHLAQDSAAYAKVEYNRRMSEDRLALLDANIAVMEVPGYFGVQKSFAEDRKEKALAAIDNKVSQQSVTSLNLWWVTFGAGVQRDRFTHLTPGDTAGITLVPITHTDRQMQLALSYYSYDDYLSKDRFLTVGLRYRRGNNVNSLTSATVRTTKAVTGDTTQIYYTEQKVLQGDYRTRLDELTAYIDYYQYLEIFSSTRIACHLNPAYLVRDGYKPELSLTLGLLYPFRKAKSPESIANVEVFIRFRDLMNDRPSGDGTPAGATLGLSASFPINFLTN